MLIKITILIIFIQYISILYQSTYITYTNSSICLFSQFQITFYLFTARKLPSVPNAVTDISTHRHSMSDWNSPVDSKPFVPIAHRVSLTTTSTSTSTAISTTTSDTGVTVIAATSSSNIDSSTDFADFVSLEQLLSIGNIYKILNFVEGKFVY